MDADVVFLSRCQFALTAIFHYLFPPLSIGLSIMLVFMEGRYLWTKDRMYESMTRFWTKVFAVNFAMGVSSGIVMEFQFGTNFGEFTRYVGDIFGAVLASEAIFAFFLESGFLAVLLFGWDKVSPKVHFFATVMVALGTTFSAVWIIIANSFMHTPVGYSFGTTATGTVRLEMASFFDVIFSPSSMGRLWHTLMGAYMLACFFVMSISAYYILKGRHLEFARRSFKLALIWGSVVVVLLMASADKMARIVSFFQPAKLAALEGIYKTSPDPTGFCLIGYPDPEKQEVVGIKVPYLLSALVYRDPFIPVRGLDAFKPEERPPVVIPFMAYHTMITCGVIFMLLIGVALFFYWRGTLFEQRWLLWIFVFAVVLPYIANECGWICAEVGRQPYLVYGIMRTDMGVSKNISAGEVSISIFMFLMIYSLLFAIWVYVLHHKIAHGPEAVEDLPSHPGLKGESTEKVLKEIYDVAALRADQSSKQSMTEAKDQPPPPSPK